MRKYVRVFYNSVTGDITSRVALQVKLDKLILLCLSEPFATPSFYCCQEVTDAL